MLELRLIALGGAAATIVLALATRWRAVQAVDDAIERGAGHARRSALAHRAARIGTQPGEPYMHPAIGATTAVALLAAGTRPAIPILVPLAAASIGAIIAHHAVKRVYRRPRPAIALAKGKTEPAFPSGHTTDATAVLATSAYLLAHEGMLTVETAIVAAALLALGTGVSRVLLGWHWATDVVGGWLTGCAVAACCTGLYEMLRLLS